MTRHEDRVVAVAEAAVEETGCQCVPLGGAGRAMISVWVEEPDAARTHERAGCEVGAVASAPRGSESGRCLSVGDYVMGRRPPTGRTC